MPERGGSSSTGREMFERVRQVPFYFRIGDLAVYKQVVIKFADDDGISASLCLGELQPYSSKFAGVAPACVRVPSIRPLHTVDRKVLRLTPLDSGHSSSLRRLVSHKRSVLLHPTVLFCLVETSSSLQVRQL